MYEFGRVRDAFISRFSLNISVRGLDISNVYLNDTGNYTCVDKNGQGDRHIHHLTVDGKRHQQFSLFLLHAMENVCISMSLKQQFS